MSENSSKPPLGPGPSDHVASFVRGGVGSVPIVGPALSELVTQIIPGVRLQRIETYLRCLDTRLSEFEQEAILAMASAEDAIELIEEGGAQATRALSPSRHERLASLVANGITGNEKDRIETKRLLILLREIDDDQIVILMSYTLRYSRDPKFRDTHKNILGGVHPHMQSDRSTIDAATIDRLSRKQLVSLGLLAYRFKKPRKGEPPEFDEKTGSMKVSGMDITPLGLLLLKRLDLLGTDEC
jgi:hypothetical protein